MSEIIPDEGLEWVTDKTFGSNPSEYAYIVAVGDGQSSPSPGDTELDNEVYRSNDDSNDCTVEKTSATEITARITLSGGLQIPADTDVNELGIFISDGTTLLYREVNDTVTIGSGEKQTFETIVNVENL
jgi:hypothetical protein